MHACTFQLTSLCLLSLARAGKAAEEAGGMGEGRTEQKGVDQVLEGGRFGGGGLVLPGTLLQHGSMWISASCLASDLCHCPL